MISELKGDPLTGFDVEDLYVEVYENGFSVDGTDVTFDLYFEQRMTCVMKNLINYGRRKKRLEIQHVLESD